MRVIAGTARGRTLRAPEQAVVRPTTDLVRGAIFSMLEAEAYKRGYEPDEEGRLAMGIAWPRVLDLFAGSGALGIEALSRGARWADFVEQQRDASRAILANLHATGFADRARVHTAPVHLALARLAGPVDAVFIDPPYADDPSLQEALDTMDRYPVLAPEGVIVLEQASDREPPVTVGGLPLRRTRRHGKTRVSLYADITDGAVPSGHD